MTQPSWIGKSIIEGGWRSSLVFTQSIHLKGLPATLEVDHSKQGGSNSPVFPSRSIPELP